MARHRNLRNRNYSYDEDYWDEDDYDAYYDQQNGGAGALPLSPRSKSYMYRRNSREKQQNLFSFIDTAGQQQQGQGQEGQQEQHGQQGQGGRCTICCARQRK